MEEPLASSREGDEDKYGKRPADIDAMYSLKINNVWEASKEEIVQVFSTCGEVGDVHIPWDHYARREPGEKPKLKGYAFVRFKSKDHAKRALEELEGKDLNGKPMGLQWVERLPPKRRHFPDRDRDRDNYRGYERRQHYGNGDRQQRYRPYGNHHEDRYGYRDRDAPRRRDREGDDFRDNRYSRPYRGSYQERPGRYHVVGPSTGYAPRPDDRYSRRSPRGDRRFREDRPDASRRASPPGRRD